MKKLYIVALLIMGLTLEVSYYAFACGGGFYFPTRKIPVERTVNASSNSTNVVNLTQTMPTSPILGSISNSSAFVGGTLTVYASIKSDIQQIACCGENCDRTDCELADWYMKPVTDISPSPPCIPNPKGDTGNPATSNPACVKNGNPKLYYYTNTDVAYPQSVEMEYDAITKKFKGIIPLYATFRGDVLYYYIVVSDSRGNVTSMLPDRNTAACKSTSSWDSKYETPPINNCSLANSYEECSKNKTGTPTCGNSYTINDRQDDTCGQPDADGTQTVTAGQGPLDILGFSVSAGKGFIDLPNTDVICAKIGLNGTPPLSGGPIDGYMMMFFNPDIEDPNPADSYLPNVMTITYTPETSGACRIVMAESDSTKSLWDGECLTNPNTSTGDLTGKCMVISGNDSEKKLKVNFNNGTLKFIAQNEVQTYSGKKTIIGGKSGMSKMIFLTGQINLTGGTVFWYADRTAGLTMIKDTKSVYVAEGGDPPMPMILTETTCKSNGVGTSSVCTKSAPMPENNQCVVEFAPSPDSFATGYKIYHSTNPDAEYNQDLAEFLADVPKTTSSYTYTTNALDGKTHYFFMTGIDVGGETSWNTVAHATKTTCRVEDWVVPPPPTGLVCSTPAGSEKKCSCTWTPSASDPSTTGYDVKVKDVANKVTRELATNAPFHFVNDTGTAANPLVNGSVYEYSVRAVDIGENHSDWATSNCVPEDKKAPAQVDSLSVSRKAGVLGINASWEPGAETDISGYNLYGCKRLSEGYDCETRDGVNGGNGYTQIQSTFPQSSSTITVSETDLFGQSAAWWCFWVEACDTASNCSAFSTFGTYRKCLKVSLDEHLTAPLWPPNQSGGNELKATPLPEGNKCKLEWLKICNGEGTEGDFNDRCEKCPAGGCIPNPCSCDFPDNLQLAGYKIMRSTTSIVPSPGDATPVLSIGTSSNPSVTDSGLENDRTYYYRVYGIDGVGLFSRAAPEPAAVACTPKDILPPNKPVFSGADGMTFGVDWCKPKWNEVADKGPVIYNVWRCELTGANNCTSAAQYATVTAHIWAPQHEFQDTSAAQDHNYVYCLTASDIFGNTSAVYETGDHPNCLPCSPGNACGAPGYINEYLKNDGFGAGWTFSKSPSDNVDGTYVDGEGYNIYYCTYDNSTSCTHKLNSTPIQKVCDDSETESCHVDEVPGATGKDAYLAVTYTGPAAGGCKESVKILSAEPIKISHLDACEKTPIAADCKIRIDFGFDLNKGIYFKKYELQACKFATDSGCMNNAYKPVITALSGITVELYDVTNGTQVSYRTTNKSGTIDGAFYVQTSKIIEGHDYKVRALIPAEVVYGNTLFAEQCVNKATRNPSTDVCIVELTNTLKPTANLQPITVAPTTVPPADGFGAEIGNANCDGKVNTNDLAAIKFAYNTKRGDPCYRAWADFNMDGKVNINDLTYIKENYNKKFIDGEATGAKLCPDAAATDNEMKPLTGTCCDKTSPLYPCR